MSLFDRILDVRGLDSKSKAAFLLPDYSKNHDPFLLSDMGQALERIMLARQKQEKIIIYGDYDIDGLTATALLMDAFASFGFKNVDVFIPNRFVEGYGLTVEAIEKIASSGVKLILTVDCGSASEKEIIRANELGVDLIVSDHHNITLVETSAIAVINPKRADNNYPFKDLSGVGVAFKLVQALQTRIDGLPKGQEKWLLDLVAFGTVCDMVSLVDENRVFVYWGLKVLSKTKRPGLKALMAVSKVEPRKINSRSLGYYLGPRMNAAGRIETAQHALDMLIATDPIEALEKAQYLDDLNVSRRIDQEKIMKEAILQAEKYESSPVLVVSGDDWNHGIVGIVASKLLEKYKKPAFVLQEIGKESKGSARSYGDFNLIEAIQACKEVITNGGGHKLAAGVKLPTENIVLFRKKINEHYKRQKLVNQQSLLLPKADALAELFEVTEELVDCISQLEPFGNGNPQPILKSENLIVVNIRRLGSDSRHVKMELQDTSNQTMQFLSFNAPEHFFVEPGEMVNVWYHADINEWNGQRSVEGHLLHVESINSL